MNSNIKSVKSAVWREFSRINFTLLTIFLFRFFSFSFFFFCLQSFLLISFNLNVLKLGSNNDISLGGTTNVCVCFYLVRHKHLVIFYVICLSHGQLWAIIEVTDVSHLTQPMLVTVFCIFWPEGRWNCLRPPCSKQAQYLNMISDFNGTQTRNHSVRKGTLNHIAKLALKGLFYLNCWVFVYELSCFGL